MWAEDAEPLVPGLVDDVVRHEILAWLGSETLLYTSRVSRAWRAACLGAVRRIDAPLAARILTTAHARMICDPSALVLLPALEELDTRQCRTEIYLPGDRDRESWCRAYNGRKGPIVDAPHNGGEKPIVDELPLQWGVLPVWPCYAMGTARMRRLALGHDVHVSPTSLAAMENLVELRLSGARKDFLGITTLARLTSLRALDVSFADWITDHHLAFLADRLTALNVNGVGGHVTDAGLARLTRLRHLVLGRLGTLGDAGLSHLTALEVLSLHGNMCISNAGLAPLTRLVRLDLSCHKGAVTLAGLAPLARLAELNLRGTGLSVLVAPLLRLPLLVRVYVDATLVRFEHAPGSARCFERAPPAPALSILHADDAAEARFLF